MKKDKEDEVRTHIIKRFNDISRKLKQVSVKVEGQTILVEFEKNFFMRINKAEAEVLKVKK